MAETKTVKLSEELLTRLGAKGAADVEAALSQALDRNDETAKANLDLEQENARLKAAASTPPDTSSQPKADPPAPSQAPTFSAEQLEQLKGIVSQEAGRAVTAAMSKGVQFAQKTAAEPADAEAKDAGFDSMVKARISEGMTEADAIRSVRRDHPEAHAKWFQQLQEGKAKAPARFSAGYDAEAYERVLKARGASAMN